MELEEETLQRGAQDEGDERDQRGGEEGPDDEGVPLPRPEHAGGGEGVVTHGAEESLTVQRELAGVEDAVAYVYEDEEQGELERVDEVVGDLGRYQVQTQDEGHGKAEEGGRAEQRIDADGYPNRERPGEAAGGGSDAQQMHDRRDDVPLEEKRDGCGERSCHAGLR